MDTPKFGQIGWLDLTVPDAVSVRSFYEQVVGWASSPIDMGGYEDFCMTPTGADGPVTGICHARGDNQGIPPVWMPYFTVPDLEASLRTVTAAGGSIVRPVREMGEARFAMIRDPAGACCALFQPAPSSA